MVGLEWQCVNNVTTGPEPLWCQNIQPTFHHAGCRARRACRGRGCKSLPFEERFRRPTDSWRIDDMIRVGRFNSVGSRAGPQKVALAATGTHASTPCW